MKTFRYPDWMIYSLLTGGKNLLPTYWLIKHDYLNLGFFTPQAMLLESSKST